MEPHTHPENPTTKDLYEVVNHWGERHEREMVELRDATNHKVDDLRRQVTRVLTIFFLVSLPVIINNWGVLLTQAKSLF